MRANADLDPNPSIPMATEPISTTCDNDNEEFQVQRNVVMEMVSDRRENHLLSEQREIVHLAAAVNISSCRETKYN